MRTVSFSDKKVQKVFNTKFVNTFTNTVGDPTAGQSIKHRPNESPGPCLRGNGKQNVQTIFMTPEGEIFHVATGYQSSEDLLEESQFALDLFQQIRARDLDDQKSIVVNAHQKRLASPNKNQRSPLSEFDSVVSKFMPQQNFGSSTRGNRFNNRIPGMNRGVMNIPGMEMMNGFTGFGVDGDQRFSIEHPMITHKELERDPAKLVGEGSSFFASSGFGTDIFGK